MPKKSPDVDIELSVLKWLVESSGWTNEEIAKRLGTSNKNIKRIITGDKKPTFRQLQELSRIFKRPIAAFLLSEPKKEKPKPKDYRLLPGKIDKFDKKTLLTLRRTRRLQELSKELSKNIKYDTKTKLGKAKIIDNPKKLAERYRDIFELNLEKQKKFKTAYELFNYIRDILEDMNIYVFQFSMPVEDARGFVLVDDYPYIIVVNTKDNIEARLFSLMHEFGHILLGESAIDLPEAGSSTKNKVESWCNEFSAAFLLPKSIAKDIFTEHKLALTQTKTLNYLSRKYKVSKAMLLVLMKRLNFITRKEQENILNRFSTDLIKEKETKREGGVPSDRRVLAEKGNKFISLVANNFDREFITYTDALNYLSIKSNNFDKVLAKARK